MSGNSDEEGIGYGRPPASTRFTKGQSGNPKGRPKNRFREAPYESVLGQMVTIREDGEERRITAAEAFLLRLAKRGLEGNGPAARDTMNAIEKTTRTKTDDMMRPKTIVLVSVAPGSVNEALVPLRMAKKLDPYRPTARMMLEPWIVEAALERFGDRRLTRAEQETVVKATRTPYKVTWPDWWEVRP
ncbi:DUF5681 domain-containing protein [Roseovarius pacificus]|uniref:DUF5681 domain-containing protein n=1 Tax=Roseovarius pacificus TaxID=337701 RepID=UPI002A18D000|nr:DUF5681 domain-containing protein [Roseovarius pacificus]